MQQMFSESDETDRSKLYGILKNHPIVKKGSETLETDSEITLLLIQMCELEIPPEDAVLVVREIDTTEEGVGRKSGQLMGGSHEKTLLLPSRANIDIGTESLNEGFSQYPLLKATVKVQGQNAERPTKVILSRSGSHLVVDKVYPFDPGETTTFINMPIVKTNEGLLQYSTWWKLPATNIAGFKNLCEEIEDVRTQLVTEFGDNFRAHLLREYRFVTPDSYWYFNVPPIILDNTVDELLRYRKEKLLELASQGNQEARLTLVRDLVLEVQQKVFETLPKGEWGISWFRPERTWNWEIPESRISTMNFGNLDGDSKYNVYLVPETGERLLVGELLPNNMQGYFNLWFDENLTDLNASTISLNIELQNSEVVIEQIQN